MWFTWHSYAEEISQVCGSLQEPRGVCAAGRAGFLMNLETAFCGWFAYILTHWAVITPRRSERLFRTLYPFFKFMTQQGWYSQTNLNWTPTGSINCGRKMKQRFVQIKFLKKLPQKKKKKGSTCVDAKKVLSHVHVKHNERHQSEECHSSIGRCSALFDIFFMAVIKLAWINNVNRNYYYNFLYFIPLKRPNEFKIFHKTKFKDLTNQCWPQGIPVVWELCPDVVGLWLTAGKDLKYFSSCLFSIVLFLKWESMR